MNLIKYFNYLKSLSKIYAVWPLKSNTSTILRIAYEYLWWFYLVNHALHLIITLNSWYKIRNDIELFTFSWLEIVAVTEIIIILINYQFCKNHMQSLLSKTAESIATVDLNKQLHLKKRAILFAIMMLLILLTYSVIIVLYISHPAVTPWETFFTTTYYPSSIRSSVVNIIIYIHEIVVIFHSSLMVVFEAVVIIMIYGCSIRLKSLADQFRDVNGYDELIGCIREHQDSLIMAEQTNKLVRFFALKTVLCFIGYTVGAGLQIVNPEATAISLQRFGAVLLTHIIRLIMIALSADDLSTSSREIGASVYSTLWYTDEKKTVVAKKVILLRCQLVAKISVPGFMTILSLSYITGIISTAISYFTTLRVVTRS